MFLDLTDDRKEARTANTGFASGGATCKFGALCFYSSSVLVDSFVIRNPPPPNPKTLASRTFAQKSPEAKTTPCLQGFYFLRAVCGEMPLKQDKIWR
jgi:hypothetical protein